MAFTKENFRKKIKRKNIFIIVFVCKKKPFRENLSIIENVQCLRGIRLLLRVNITLAYRYFLNNTRIKFLIGSNKSNILICPI